MSLAPPVIVFLHSGDYDRVHQAFSIAASAVALGRPAHLYFFWWALLRMEKDELDEPSFPSGHAELEERFETRGIPTLRSLWAHLQESGLCKSFACSGSVALMSQTPGTLPPGIDSVIGWSTILRQTEGLTDRFYL